MLAALAEGASDISHFSAAADCRSTLDCLARLGVKVGANGDRVRITGAGLGGLRKSRRALDAGNSGTTMRLLAGILSGQEFRSTLDGDASLRRRPMRRVMDPLTKMGARITARDGGTAPLEIDAARLSPIEYTLPVPSAQVKSAVLLAGLFAEGVTSRNRAGPHTRPYRACLGRIRRAPGPRRRRNPNSRKAPPASSVIWLVPWATCRQRFFFLAAAMVLPESNIVVHNVGLKSHAAGRPRCPRIQWVRLSAWCLSAARTVNSLAMSLCATSRSRGGTIEGDVIAQLIDELPAIAVLGPYTEQGIEIRATPPSCVVKRERPRPPRSRKIFAAWAPRLRNVPMVCAWRDARRVACTEPRLSRTATTVWPSNT